MSESILDEFDDERPAYRLPRDARVGNIPALSQRNRFVGRTCCGHTLGGKPCRRIGGIIRDGHAYCHDHDPGPEAA